MVNILYIHINNQKKTIKINYLILVLYLLTNIREINSESCKNYNNFSNKDCFNNILIFNNKKYRAGHFAENKNGDMIIEYSDDLPGKSRLFYGLKKNGNYYFADEKATKEIEDIKSDNDLYKRYESFNIFVSLEDDVNKTNEYLFSTSSYQSLTELYNSNINEDDYFVRQTSEFLGNEIFSYVYPILEVKTNDKIIYFCVYTHGSGSDGNNFTIKKFGFTSFNLSSFNNMQSVTITNNGNNRIISSFLIEDDERFVVFFSKLNNNILTYAVNFYDYDLNTYGVNMDISEAIINSHAGMGIFFKSVYLGSNIGAFIYFLNGDDGKSLNFKIIKLNKGSSYNLTSKIEKNINDFSFETNITLNDFSKIDENRLVFISTTRFSTLYILFFDLYNNYEYMKIRVYYYDLSIYKLVKEFSVFIYNNYLAFTSTVVTTSSTSDGDYFSLFMMFSYANGTYKNFDISLYFMDIEGYNSSNNLITKLLEGITIDNNIFGYILVNQVKLISIPNQILFYNEGDVAPLSNGAVLKENYKFKQNNELIKTDEYYSLDYQCIIQEPDYTTFYGNANNVINYPSNEDQIGNFKQKTFEGRINTAKFKLCHEYCATCNSLGISNNDQKCISCLPLYQYDYFNECVPEGYYIDKENNGNLVQCTPSNSKFYTNITTNKKICFKNTYNCPNEYPYWNTTTNECQKYIPPTTIITTIPTTFLINTVTSIPNAISTTIPTAIPTTILTTIISSIITTEISTSISTIIPSTISDLLCSYNNLLNNECLLLSYNNKELYEKIKSEIIGTYPANGESIVIEGEENYVFQITTSANEINSLNGNYENNYNLSMIDLGECEKLLKEENDIGEEENLIILKYEKIASAASEKNVQYEVYDPNTLKKLGLSICEETPIDLYIPITLSEKTQTLYNDLKESGYDLFNENDSFYTDICTPYESENGTDILLSDRKKDFYNTTETTCQANCQYSAYSSESKFLKCECNVGSEDIDIIEPEKFTGTTVFTSFYDVLKYSNYKVLKCSKLVFNFENIIKNIGSILTFAYFLIYLVFLIIFIVKKIYPLKLEISKLFNIYENPIFINKNNDNIEIKNSTNINLLKNNKKIKKKLKTSNKYKKNIYLNNKDAGNNNLNDNNSSIKVIKKGESSIIKERNKNGKNINLFPPKKKKKDNVIKNFETSIDVININNKNKKIIKSQKNKNRSNSKDLMILQRDSLNQKNKKFVTSVINNNNDIPKKSIEDKINKKEKISLSNYELNDLEYYDALELDKRSFYQIYWSLLRREHLIFFTFFSWGDYNIWYIKCSRFIFLLTTDMAMNVFFFSDDSMHKLYLNYGKYDFIQQIPQIIYSSIISNTLEIFLCYLSLTDKHFYQIKNIPYSINKKSIIFKILKCVKIKLIGFFAFTLLVFTFYWYLISAFCAVYQNTQITFIKDSVSSFFINLLYPFALYLIPACLRIISLKDITKKRLKCVYKLSDIIPFF